MIQRRYIDPHELRERRTESGYTQEDLAEALEVHRITVARWETVYTKPLKREHIAKLNAVLRCELRESLQPFNTARAAASNGLAASPERSSLEELLPDPETREVVLCMLREVSESETITAADLGDLEGALLLWVALRKLKLTQGGRRQSA